MSIAVFLSERTSLMRKSYSSMRVTHLRTRNLQNANGEIPSRRNIRILRIYGTRRLLDSKIIFYGTYRLRGSSVSSWCFYEISWIVVSWYSATTVEQVSSYLMPFVLRSLFRWNFILCIDCSRIEYYAVIIILL